MCTKTSRCALENYVYRLNHELMHEHLLSFELLLQKSCQHAKTFDSPVVVVVEVGTHGMSVCAASLSNFKSHVSVW